MDHAQRKSVPEQGYVSTLFWPASVIIPGIAIKQCVGARLQREGGDQCANSRRGRGHHPRAMIRMDERPGAGGLASENAAAGA